MATQLFGSDPRLERRDNHMPVILTRWVLVIVTAYTVLYGGGTRVPLWPHQTFAAALLLSNLVLHWVLTRYDAWEKLRWFVTIVDIGAVTLAISLVGQASADFYLVYFAVLMVAAVSHGIAILAALSLAICGIYGGLLYSEVGADLFRNTNLLLRVPFVFGVSLFFGTVAQEARTEQKRADRMTKLAHQLTAQKNELAIERDRLKALADIGRYALTSSTPLGPVLYEITRKVQEVVGVDRCSLIIFSSDAEFGYLAASGDDPSVDIREFEMESYPELQATLADREVTEVHPDEPAALWKKVKEHLPETSPFRSFLVVPIQLEEELLGVFFLRDEQEDRHFGGPERDFCRTVATMTASFIHGHDLLEQLRHKSRSDALTGLLNYQTFREELSKITREIRAAQDGDGEGEAATFSLVMVDIDNLKLVNDRHGHLSGNRLITEVGRALVATFPRAPAVCRFGGDEFVATVLERKDKVATQLDRFFEELGRRADEELPSTPHVSVGVAEFPTDGDGEEELLEAADQAMYLAKNGGGNQVCTVGDGLDSIAWKRTLVDAVESVGADGEDPKVTKRLHSLLDHLVRVHGKSLDSPTVREALSQISELIELDDPYANDHSRKVSRLAGAVARGMDLAEEEVIAIELGGLVHDLGKIAIPDQVLRKQGTFSEKERKLVENYPEIGAEILKPMPALAPIVSIVLHHQERWDGSGYPQGLERNDIPIGAQIVGLCDVYQALVSERPYRPALPEDTAKEIVEQNLGKHWNPVVARSFLKCLEKHESDASTEEGPPDTAGSAAGYAAARR